MGGCLSSIILPCCAFRRAPCPFFEEEADVDGSSGGEDKDEEEWGEEGEEGFLTDGWVGFIMVCV